MKGVETLYIETCNALRHYSLCILQVRTIVVAQGLVVFSAAAYTLKSGNSVSFYSVIGFGVCFTAVLLWQQRNYLGDFEIHLKQVEKLEKELGNDSIHGSWEKYKDRHKYLRDGNQLFPIMVESGPYFLYIIFFIFFAVLKRLGCLSGFVA